MRVFVTGASGFVGSAVVRDLLGAGHSVVGLARSDASAAAVEALGADVHRGSLTEPDGLAKAAAAADGTVHLAFHHDFSDYGNAGRMDLRAVEAMGAALEGSGRPLVVTSGTLMIPMFAPGRVGTEDIAAPDSDAPRVATEHAAAVLAGRGVRTSIVRLPPSVHGEGDRGFVPQLVAAARREGSAVHVGDGANRWPAVHRLDAARLFRLGLENAPAGARLHAAADEEVPMREIAATIGRLLDVPVTSVAAEQARERLGFLAGALGADNPTSSARTRELVGWRPQWPGLLADLEAGHYVDR